MTDYMVMAVADEHDAIITVLEELEFRMNDGKGDVVFVGNLDSVRRIASEHDLVLPFSAFVDRIVDLSDAIKDEEKMIFYDSGKDSSFLTSLQIMENTSCLTFLYIGNHERYYERLCFEAKPNVLFRLILSSDGKRIFPYPRSLECTRESIMDRLVNLESLTSNAFFSQDLPYVLVKEKRDDISYEDIVECAKEIGISVVVVDESELGKIGKERAVLAFSSLGHSDDFSIYFGLPFWYMNAVRLPKESITAALSITKIIERGYL